MSRQEKGTETEELQTKLNALKQAELLIRKKLDALQAELDELAREECTANSREDGNALASKTTSNMREVMFAQSWVLYDSLKENE